MCAVRQQYGVFHQALTNVWRLTETLQCHTGAEGQLSPGHDALDARVPAFVDCGNKLVRVASFQEPWRRASY